MKKIIAISVLLSLLIVGTVYIKTHNTKEVNPQNKFIIVEESKITTNEIDQNEFELMQNEDLIDVLLLKKIGIFVDIDTKRNIVSISNDKTIVRSYVNDNKYRVNDNLVNDKIVYVYNNKYYIKESKLASKFRFSIDIGIKSKNIVLLNHSLPIYSGILKHKENMSNYDNLEEKLKIIKEEKLIIGNTTREGTLVLTEDKYIGYIDITSIDNVSKSYGEKVQEKINSKTINMTWEYVNKSNPNTNNIGQMVGLNVISPTWFSLKNSSGEINSKLSETYKKWARERKYEIWPLVSNQFNKEMTREFVNNAVARERFINNLLRIYKDNGFKGINIDFENMYKEDSYVFSVFINELTMKFKENGIKVSIDVTVPDGSDFWSKCYNREELGRVVDYMVVMTYDEHWASSPVSGSVASYGWVESNIEKLLEKVPPSKLILGIPFYTREWRETPSLTIPNKMDVKSVAITLKRIKAIIEEKKPNLIWDEYSKQYYYSYIENGKLIKVWIEDEKSISEKVSLVNKYKLIGIASWRRGYENIEIWDIINKELNKK
ncbi:glycosyl hydrolase family 18 protein [Helicovermis profundi]|uniref:GH18 domain-containing protein n=1 Tax=Helicovermis profundi TaxID=3065157 RepID=A0AAU9E7I8_9FIRM|nr:hypothetical protein HLPR_24210 [Clostridia bacterium S502]